MPKYVILYKSRSQWQGSELENGDTGEFFATKEEADAKKAQLEADPEHCKGVHDAAVEAQGVEGWLEVVEAQDEDME